MTTVTNVGTLLNSVFLKHQDSVFLIDGISGKTLSYYDFLLSVLNCRDSFKKNRIRKGSTVCLFLENSVNVPIFYMGALLAGIRVVPIDPHRGSQDRADILSQLSNPIILSDVDGIPLSLPAKRFTATFFKKRKRSMKDFDVFSAIDADAIFMTTFTSGSTGVPKGVQHSIKNLILSAQSFRSRFAFDQKNIFYHNLPMTYMAGILNLFILPLISGSVIVIGERFSVNSLLNFWDLPRKWKANTFWFIPTVLSLLLELDRGVLGKRYAKNSKLLGCVGTAPLDPTLKKSFEKKYRIPLFESYGLSETLFVASNYPRRTQSPGSVGPVLPGAHIKRGRDGEVCIRVPWMFKGYIGQKPTMPNAWFASGDLGHLDTKKELRITGRKKDLIIRGGINISPRRIEELLNTMKFFKELSIIGISGPNKEEHVLCVYVPRKKPVSLEEKIIIQRQVSQKLGKEYRIDVFLDVPMILKNSNGKVDKLRLRAQFHDYKN